MLAASLLWDTYPDTFAAQVNLSDYPQELPSFDELAEALIGWKP